MKDYRIDFTLLDWESPMNGVRQKVITHHGRSCVLLSTPRQCPNGGVSVILTQRGDMLFFVKENSKWWAVADQFSSYPA